MKKKIHKINGKFSKDVIILFILFSVNSFCYSQKNDTLTWKKLSFFFHLRPNINLAYDSHFIGGIDILLVQKGQSSFPRSIYKTKPIKWTNSVYFNIGLEHLFSIPAHNSVCLGISYQPFFIRKSDLSLFVENTSWRKIYNGSPTFEINYLPYKISGIRSDVIRPEIGFMFPIFQRGIKGWIPHWAFEVKAKYGYNFTLKNAEHFKNHIFTVGLLLGIRKKYP